MSNKENKPREACKIDDSVAECSVGPKIQHGAYIPLFKMEHLAFSGLDEQNFQPLWDKIKMILNSGLDFIHEFREIPDESVPEQQIFIREGARVVGPYIVKFRSQRNPYRHHVFIEYTVTSDQTGNTLAVIYEEDSVPNLVQYGFESPGGDWFTYIMSVLQDNSSLLWAHN